MSVEEQKQAGSSSPGRNRPSAAGGEGGFRLGALVEEVVPLRGMDEGEDQLARERAERVEALVGRSRRVRLHIPKPNIRPSTRRPIALAGGGVALIAVLVASIALAAGGGGRERATERFAGEVKKTKAHLLTRSGEPLPLRTSAAHTRRRAALADKRKGARRRASHRKRHESGSGPQSAPGSGTGAGATEAAAAPEAEPVEAASTDYEGAEEAYEPPPPIESSPSPEEAAASEFNFESQQP